jgi:hypothetical protein
MTRIGGAALAASLALGLCSGVARADQRLGVDVYRKAEPVPGKTALVKATFGGDAACYRTTDGLDDVTAFYLRQGFVAREANVLRRGKVDVLLHPPTDARTGAAVRYTVLCIVPASE